MPAGPDRRTPAAILAPASLVLLAAAIGISTAEPGFVPEYWGDEFLLPWYGKQVTMGRIPYVDFFMFLGPVAAYGSAALVALTHAGIAPFRILMVAVLIVAALSLYGIARARGAARGLAWCIAAWLPAILYSLWPMSSHQWMAVSAGLAAVAAVAVPASVTATAAFLGGLLASVSGLTVQTVGVIALPAVLVVCWRRSARPAPALARVAAGAALPLAVCTALLVAQGAFGGFVRRAILWPLDSYVQEGGFNDGSVALLVQQRPILSALSDAFPASDHVANLLVLPLGLLAFLPLVSRVLRRSDEPERRRITIWLLACLCAVLVIFEMGRSDVPHLAYLSPVFLAVLAGFVSGDARGARALRVFLVAGLCIGAARWAITWAGRPPDPRAAFTADAHIAGVVDRALIAPLPAARARQEPIVYLARPGALLYVYWSPLPPPVEWVAAPSWGANTQEQLTALASFLRSNAVPWVIVSAQDTGIISEPSPLRDVLRSHYRHERTIPAGEVFARR